MWSTYFNGSNSLRVDSSNFTGWPSPATFTIELYVFWTGAGGNYYQGCVSSLQNNSGGIGITIVNGYFQLRVDGTSVLTGPAVTPGVWYHVAVCRYNSNKINFYVNGVLIGTKTSSITLSKTTFVLGTYYLGGGSNFFKGYLSNVRFVKDALYPYTFNSGAYYYSYKAFEPPTSPLSAVFGTQFLLCQSKTHRDYSFNNIVPTTYDTFPTVSTFVPDFFQKYDSYSPPTNGGSGYFNGSSDYLTVDNSTDFDIGSSPFTLECWYYQTADSSGSVMIIFSRGGGDTTFDGATGFQYYLYSYGGLYFQWYTPGGVGSVSSSTSPSLNCWHHVAIGYDGTTTKMWIDGLSVSTDSSHGYAVPTSSIYTNVGGYEGLGSEYFNGYISDLRFVKGSDVYGVSNDFIQVPSNTLTAISNTQFLLKFQNSGIVDMSSSNDIQTVGNAQTDNSTTLFGSKSINFDGNSQLSIKYKPNLYDWWNTDYTIEAWVYPSDLSTWENGYDQGIPNMIGNFSLGNNWSFGPTASGTVKFYYYTNTTNYVNHPTTISAGQWTHIAMTHTSSGINVFVNGVGLSSPVSVSGSPASDANTPLNISNYNGSQLIGNIKDLRITKGYARYKDNFVPPTADYPSNYNPVTKMTDIFVNSAAASPNTIPNLVGWYDVSSVSGSTWTDMSGNGNDASINGPTVVSISGYGAKMLTSALSGSNSGYIDWPSNILPSQYTLFHVGRRNTYGKILQCKNTIWTSGHESNVTGGARRNGTWLTRAPGSYQSAISSTNWLISADSNILYRANGVDMTYFSTLTPPTYGVLTINNNPISSPDLYQNFYIAEVIVYDRLLSKAEIRSVELYLSNKYGIYITR